MNTPRSHIDDVGQDFISPQKQVNAGLWTLWSAATVFLGFRLWCKITRRHGLWYDDYILILAWLVLMLNDSLISYEFATGYVTEKWDDRMHILINISSCGTLVGQALSKTAFGVTLLRMTNQWQRVILWFCIFFMNTYMIIKVLFQWAMVCDRRNFQQWYRLGFCIYYDFRNSFKMGGQITNITMDFVFALFPWVIAWPLDMRRIEKVGLCITMSLGLLVAVVAAARTDWKDSTNPHDEWYYWRLGMSMIWYSSEIAGTIMVQCIPVLRPFLREMHTSLTSRKLASTEDRPAKLESWRSSGYLKQRFSSTRNIGDDGKAPENIALGNIPEETPGAWRHGGQPRISYSPSEVERAIQTSHTSPLEAESRSGPDQVEYQDAAARSSLSPNWLDIEAQEHGTGLSPPPRRAAHH